jgi:subtilisin family serine protease
MEDKLMQFTVILAKPDSAILSDPTTTVLAKYPDGGVLVRTQAVIDESTRAGDTLVTNGLRLPDMNPEDLQRGREQFDLAAEAGDDKPIIAYIELAGPPLGEWLEQIKKLGVTLLSYQPQNTYLAQGTPDQLKLVAQLSFVLYITKLINQLKKQVAPNEAGTSKIWILAIGNLDTASALIKQLRGLPGVAIEPGVKVDVVSFYVRIPAAVDSEGHDALVRDARVIATEPYTEAKLEDELADLIVAGQYSSSTTLPTGSYLKWLEDNGINGQGVTIGIVDGGVDVSHPAFKGRIRDLAHGARSWHGTGVAGHAAGAYLDEKDRNGLIYGVGIAPAAELLAQDKSDVTTAPGAICRETVTEKGSSGVAGSVQNNSWGAGTQEPMDYSSLEATYDRLVRNADPSDQHGKPLVICFSSGNNGSAGLTRPKGAKNIIVTGNSESYRPDVGGTDSDNINEVYAGTHPSSWGNCGDGRIRPDLVAPGEWTSTANYDSHQGEREFISNRLTYVGGSSGASPKTAGACALLIQWWRQHDNDQSPSPAMLRALLVNGAVDTSTGGPIPNKYQGWGRLNVANVVSQDIDRVFLDQTIMLTQFGETKEWRIRVTDPAKPIKITMAYTDPPGNVGTGSDLSNSAVVNRLALRVYVDNDIYPANNFSQGWSVPTDQPQQEGWDNLQNIYLPAGAVSGSVRVTVSTLQLAANCLTGMPDQPQQDFALVISNGRLDSAQVTSDVFVVVDSAARGQSKIERPDNFYASGDGDSRATQAGYWNMIDSQAKIDQGKQGSIYSNSTDVDSWWKSPDLWSKTETQKAGAESEHVALAGLIAGSDMALASGHSLYIAVGVPDAESAKNGDALSHIALDTEREDAHSQLAQAGALNFGEALAKLMASWNRFGQPSDDGIVRRRVAVMVVGSGTRITTQDIDALRRLAFLARLYLVSDHAPILAFLAQRIHRVRGIAFRLARNAEDLANVLRATLVEATGAVQVAVSSEAQAGPDVRVCKHAFQVSTLDRHLIIRIANSTGQPSQQIRIRRPNTQPVSPAALGSASGFQISQSPGALEVVADATTDSQNWAGTWEVIVREPIDAEPITIEVWTRGSLNLTLRSLGTTSSEAGGGDEEHLVSLHSTPGVSLNRVSLEPRAISVDAPVQTEANRPITAIAELSRLDREYTGFAAAETGKLPTAASLATRLTMPAGSAVAILDLPAVVQGVDGEGNPFRRFPRLNLLRLEPRSAWRRRANKEDQPIIIEAKITELVLGRDNLPVALRLRRGDFQKYVQVNLPTLRVQLACIKTSDDQFRFGICGQELVALIRLFNGFGTSGRVNPSSGDVSGYGISAPLPNQLTSQLEDTQGDYPLTSRFVQAKYYRAGPRTIQRVVIHITDGGASINGTIRWFQNPQDNDGTQRMVSAHYIVGQDGEVVQMVQDANIAFHANAANRNSIGIEHVARAPRAFGAQDQGLFPTAVQYASSAALVRWLCEQYSIPMDREHILGHSEADSNTTHRGCPNAVWNWDYFMQMVTEAMSSPEPTPDL